MSGDHVGRGPSALAFEGRRFVLPASTCGVDRPGRLALGIIPPGPVEHEGETLTYSFEPGALDLGLARSGRAPVLLEHRWLFDSLLGAVAAARVEDGVLKLLLRFGPGPDADRALELLADGFPLSLSVGCAVRSIERTGPGRCLATRWALREVSVCLLGRLASAHARALEPDADPAELLARLTPAEGDPGRLALRRRLLLDRWLSWTRGAAAAVAAELEVDAGRVADVLSAEVERHCAELEQAFRP